MFSFTNSQTRKPVDDKRWENGQCVFPEPFSVVAEAETPSLSPPWK